MDTKKKILKLAALKKKLSVLRRKKRIAFTNGCFDVLHFGHVDYLQRSKKADRFLIVGLNSDDSVRSIKGKKRPIVPEGQRAAILAALECVDYVVLFDEDTPIKLIEAIKPDILIKGADWKGKEFAGSEFLKTYGGKVELVRLVPNLSSTNIIEAVLKDTFRLQDKIICKIIH